MFSVSSRWRMMSPACRRSYVARSPVDGSVTKENLNARDLVDTTAVTRRFDLTDAAWARLPSLPPSAKRDRVLDIDTGIDGQTPVDLDDLDPDRHLSAAILGLEVAPL